MYYGIKWHVTKRIRPQCKESIVTKAKEVPEISKKG
jgi:hypothetical protein